MKKLFKNLMKAFSLILVVAISIISFTACSKNKNKQASVAPTVESTTDTTNKQENENIAEEVTDNEELNGDISSDSNETSKPTPDENNSNDNTTSDEASESKYPILPGIYKFDKLNLSFEDIYYEDESSLLAFFETRDINGVYDIVHKLGFESFVKNITYYTNNETNHEIVISLNKNESEGSELAITPLYIGAVNSYFYFSDSIIYSVENGTIIEEANKPKFLINEKTNKVSLLIPFKYTNETSEVIYTPLYIKADITIINQLDIMKDESLSSSYHYLDSSASIKSLNGLLNEEEALKKLAEMLNVNKNEIIDTLNNFELYFSETDELYICNTDRNTIITEKISNKTNYLIYGSVYFNIINEYYDFDLKCNILNIEIEIDENTRFVCSFYNEK